MTDEKKEEKTNLFMSTFYAEQMQKLRKQVDILHRDVLSNEKLLWFIVVIVCLHLIFDIKLVISRM